MFKDNEEQEPYIRMVIPSEYPNGIIVAKHPTTLKVNALKLVCLSIGLWGGGGGGWLEGYGLGEPYYTIV